MYEYYTIYKTTNVLNGRYYFGMHRTNDLNDDYLGSGLAIKSAIKKYGSQNFKKEVIHIFDNESDMRKKEEEIITDEMLTSEVCYNISPGGCGGGDIFAKFWENASEEYKEKHRKKLSESRKGRIVSEKERQRLSKKAKDFWANDENKKRVSASLKKSYESQEVRDKISKRLKGKKKSREAVENNRNAQIGRKMSEEAKEKMKRNNARPSAIKVVFDGKTYSSKKEAAEDLGICVPTLNKILKSDNPLETFNNRQKRVKHSKETKIKMKETRSKGVPASIPVSINGVSYPNKTIASKEIGFSVVVINNRLNSDEWPSWFII